ncbi:MAG: hypothetical protein IAX21_00915 [Candidatus Bathyarchaeota archaeon]|nr:hypothetical protein [Candidatus Bathyarchaeum tardum]WGM90469.1 MAG: hypothetical protein NUK63_04930 [Candidatus Bathyarchaeum tardum]WNZ29463.1 MAG: hypothetical protein IAX21_00915 [Candidatus Bathyarchaeota archaeon]
MIYIIKPLFKAISHLPWFYSEEAGELVKLGTTIVEDVGSIDNSLPERVPHEEYIGKDLAKARLLMPLKIFELQKQVQDLQNDMQQLVQVLKEAIVPRDTHSVSLKDRNYIS